MWQDAPGAIGDQDGPGGRLAEHREEAGPPGAAILGLSARTTPNLIREVRAGFTVDALDRFMGSTKITQQQLATFAAISSRSLSRRSAGGRLSTEQSDRVLRAARIFEQAASIFDGDVDAARHWLLAPARALGGEIPLELAATEVGAREVEAVLGRLDHGVFT